MQHTNVAPGTYRVVPSGTTFMVQCAMQTMQTVRVPFLVIFHRTKTVTGITWRTVVDGERPAIFSDQQRAQEFITRVTGPFLNYAFR